MSGWVWALLVMATLWAVARLSILVGANRAAEHIADGAVCGLDEQGFSKERLRDLAPKLLGSLHYPLFDWGDEANVARHAARERGRALVSAAYQLGFDDSDREAERQRGGNLIIKMRKKELDEVRMLADWGLRYCMRAVSAEVLRPPQMTAAEADRAASVISEFDRKIALEEWALCEPEDEKELRFNRYERRVSDRVVTYPNETKSAHEAEESSLTPMQETLRAAGVDLKFGATEADWQALENEAAEARQQGLSSVRDAESESARGRCV